MRNRILFLVLVVLQPGPAAPASAETLSVTVNTSEPVIVTGSPRIVIDVGGVTRQASYASGSGTAALVFGYQVQPGDFDMDGIALASPLQLNGGAILDASGNPPASLAFTIPDTSSLKVQTYTAAFATSPITGANAGSVSFTIAKAPVGGSFSYAVTSSGGAGSITGSGTISSLSQTVSGVDVSGLLSGTLTLSVTVSTAAGGTGTAKTATSTPTFTGVLDGVSASPDAAYSTRRLTSAYSGPLLAVRRSTDNAQRDIAANLGGGLDTNGLTGFCGSASCFVSTWYDQSGNLRHATQANTARQPRIVNAGAIDSINGVPAPYFNGSSMVLTTAAALPSANAMWSSYLVRVFGSGGGGRGRVWATNTGNGNPSVNAILTGDDYFSPTGNFNGTFTGNPRIVSWAVNSLVSSRLWTNGTLASTSAVPSWTGGAALLIGDLPAATRALDGQVQSIFLGNGSFSTADRQTLERWLGALSGISVP